MHFAQIPELDFSFMIQRSLKLMIPLINVSFGSHPACLEVELPMLFDILNGGMLTWMFLIFPWKLFQFYVSLHRKNGRIRDSEMNELLGSVLPRERSNCSGHTGLDESQSFSASHSQ